MRLQLDDRCKAPYHSVIDVQVLMDFPQLTMTLPDGREESIMKRTTLVRSVALHGGA